MAEKEKEKDMPAAKSGTKSRSPNYPAVGLEEAVKRVKKLYDADGRAGSPVEAAVKHIGFSGTHGTAMVVLSALKKFGLIEDKGGRLIPSQNAIDILTFPEAHPRRTQALQAAVVKPTAYKAILDQFRKIGELPSNASLRPELIADRGYTEKSVDGFLKDLRASLIYAGLLVGNNLVLSKAVGNNEEPPDDVTPGNESEVDTENKTDPKINKPAPPSRHEVSDWSGPRVRFDLPRGNAIEIRLKSKVTAEEFEKIKKIFDLSEVAFLDDESANEE